MPTNLETPWLRSELIQILKALSNQAWLECAMDDEGRPGHDLAVVYDFFDDTGVLDDPDRSIGYLIFDQEEASAMQNLGIELDSAIRAHTAPGPWRRVADAARSALTRLESHDR